MNLEDLYREIETFSRETHGSSDLFKEEVFVRGESEDTFAPLKHLCKKVDGLDNFVKLQESGFVCDSHDLYDHPSFQKWYEHQFSRKLKRLDAKKMLLFYLPDNKAIFDAIETVNTCYQTLRNEHIILNNKNLPVQLGEWYCKFIFGLQQRKSTSQRGFDCYLGDKRVEIRVEWGDHSSPKGVKIRKSLVTLSDYCIMIYIANNFMIREICFLDSDFIMRKFSGKGHTIFLKDSDVTQYFFSKSSKHLDKVVNSSALLKYSSPTFAMKLAESF